MSAKSRSIATAVALLFLSGGILARADNNASSAQVRCFAINSCKGQVSAQQLRVERQTQNI